MSLWSRIANVVRGDRLSREIDEELQAHLAEAIERGRDPVEARRAFGPTLRVREGSRDIRMLAWLDSIRADAIFGWRQLNKRKATSAVAVLSLALAMGACLSAFRLIDALLLRPLPVATPERLYSLSHESKDADGRPRTIDSYEYPMFRQMQAAVREQADLIAMSYAYRVDLTYRSEEETEKARLQYVSEAMFGSFGLRPAVGRLLGESDNVTVGAHPYAVLSHDYWTRRFGADAKVLGRGFRMGSDLYTIVGVCERRFTGTETGTVTDIFVPTMMNGAVTQQSSGWVRIMAHLKPGVDAESVRDRLRPIFQTAREERAKGFTSMHPEVVAQYLRETSSLTPAAAGVSRLQREYRRSLVALGVLVILVLLIACANVANLMTAQAGARTREIGLRVSLGAGQWRMAQMVLLESSWLAFLAAALGGVFAWWSAPFVASRINPPDNPARLALTVDWRVAGFAVAVTFAATLLFGLPAALRASGVRPASALKGGDDPHSRRRVMHALIAVQVAFCFLVLFVGGMFIATNGQLVNQSNGFSADRILLVDTVTQRAQAPVYWEQVLEHLRTTPGVETAALAGWGLLDGTAQVGSISIDSGAPGKERAYFMNVSPGWMDTMKVPLVKGRDFRAGEASPGVAMVNQAFVKQYFAGENPVGKFFERVDGSQRFQVVGIVGDARYREVRGPMMPVAYTPFRANDAKGAPQPQRSGTIVIRTSGPNPLSVADILRREVALARAGFRVSEITTQESLVRAQTVRERLLALLAVFFAAVALLLSGLGLYGVLDYSVLQRRREIGIRMAIGAQAGEVARRVTADVFAMVLCGAVAGLTLGLLSVHYIEALLYQVKPTDLGILAIPSLAILVAALVAALPPVLRAVRIDPVQMLRSE